MIIETIGRRLRLAVIGGGPGSVIGEVHRAGARHNHLRLFLRIPSIKIFLGSISSAMKSSSDTRPGNLSSALSPFHCSQVRLLRTDKPSLAGSPGNACGTSLSRTAQLVRHRTLNTAQ